MVLLGSKASIEIDDERTATLIEKVNEILEAFIGIDDLELGKQKEDHPCPLSSLSADEDTKAKSHNILMVAITALI